MKDFFGNKIDLEKVGIPERFEFPMIVTGLKLAGIEYVTDAIKSVLDNVSLVIVLPAGKHTVMLNSLEWETFKPTKEQGALPLDFDAKNVSDELIAPCHDGADQS